MWWCHGAPGIALGLLRIQAALSADDLLPIIRASLRTHPPHVRAPNLSLCHGLAGLGQIYLEAHVALGEQEWLDRALATIRFILALARREEGGGLTWLVENTQVPTGDLMVGNAGILHLLLRARSVMRGGDIGYPMLPPLAGPSNRS